MGLRLTIGKKLLFSYGALFAALVVLGMESWNTIRSLSQTFDNVIATTVAKIILADTIDKAKSDMLSAQRGFVIYSSMKNEEQVRLRRADFQRNADLVKKSLDEIRPLIVTEDVRQIAMAMSTEVSEWRTAFVEIDRLCMQGDAQGAIAYANANALPISEKLAEQSERITEVQQKHLADDKAVMADRVRAATVMLLVIFGAGVALCGLAFYAIRNVNSALSRIAAEMQEGSSQVAGAAAQLSSASQEVAQGASEQAASLEETSASAEEISSMTQKNADNATSAVELIHGTERNVAQANEKLGLMLASMKNINASSEKISKIIKVIDEIAFQTNILALNAAVEAARAGEAGMGFAVVADEVRSLAQRSAQAAKDTADLIEESISTSSQGSAMLDQVAHAIAAVTESTTKVQTLVEEVNLSTKEQARGIEEVTKSVSQMEQITQKAAASAEESASASEELNSQAEAMSRIVASLHEMVGGTVR